MHSKVFNVKDNFKVRLSVAERNGNTPGLQSAQILFSPMAFSECVSAPDRSIGMLCDVNE
jgi:hypothetical protein